jgi:hypothetical protein
MIMYAMLLIRSMAWTNRILLGYFLRVRVLTFLWVAMLWDGALGIDRVMDNFADFEISFVIRKELLPMLKTLNKAQGADRQMNCIRTVRLMVIPSIRCRLGLEGRESGA